MSLHAGLAPEVSWVGLDGGLQAAANVTFNILRPEAVESLYMLWRVTGDARFRDMGWRIFEAFAAASRARPAKHLPSFLVLHLHWCVGWCVSKLSCSSRSDRLLNKCLFPLCLSHEGCMCCG